MDLRISLDHPATDYDTGLYVRTNCIDHGTEVACNDDADGLHSQLDYDLSLGQQILIAVSGFDGETGTWVLNITPG